MSKYIQFTDEMREELRRDFEQTLQRAKLADGKVSYTKTFNAPQSKATLLFTPVAYSKMLMLVAQFDSEVAWHGVAFRGSDPEKNEYLITDILVYPQEVDGSNVNTDQEKYQTWLMGLDDEVFPHVRMQGHSHVNFSTNPSSVDLTHQSSILDQLEGDMFYIFIIWNKKMEHNIKIYDLAKNILFEPADITVSMTTDGVDFDAFIKDAKEKVVRKTYTPSPGSYYGGRYYGGYTGVYYGGGSTASDKKSGSAGGKVTTPIPASKLPATPEKRDETPYVKDVDMRPKSHLDDSWYGIWDDDGYYGQQAFPDTYMK